jgi:hypothetical protein
MAVSLTTATSNLQLLLNTKYRSAGTVSSPIFMTQERIQSPPGTLGVVGLEKVFLTIPLLFQPADLACTIRLNNTSQTVTSADFDSIDLDVGYTEVDHQCGHKLSLPNLAYAETPDQVCDILEGIRQVLTSVLDTLSEGYFFDWMCKDWSSAWSTFDYTDRQNNASVYMNNGYRDLSLVWVRPESQSGAEDLNLSGPLITKIFGVSNEFMDLSGTLDHLAIFPDLINLQFFGPDFLRVRCSLTQGTMETLSSTSTVHTTDLLGTVPMSGLAGDTLTYINFFKLDSLTVDDLTINTIKLFMEDEDGNPMIGLKDYSVVLGVSFVDKLETLPASTMTRVVRKRLRDGSLL